MAFASRRGQQNDLREIRRRRSLQAVFCFDGLVAYGNDGTQTTAERLTAEGAGAFPKSNDVPKRRADSLENPF